MFSIKFKFWKMRALEPDEIKEVENILEARHPLYYNGAGFNDIFPFWRETFWNHDKDGDKRESELRRILPNSVQRSVGVLFIFQYYLNLINKIC